MKKIFALCFTVIFASATFGQQVDKTKVPAVVIKAYKAKFTGATEAKWEKKDTIYSVEFLMGEEATTAQFDTLGIWHNTEWTIPVEYTPKTIKNYLDSVYAGCIYKLSIKDFWTSGKYYIAEVSKKKEIEEVYFSLKGQFKKSEKVRAVRDEKKTNTKTIK